MNENYLFHALGLIGENECKREMKLNEKHGIF
jgi:hypothetical protein